MTFADFICDLIFAIIVYIYLSCTPEVQFHVRATVCKEPFYWLKSNVDHLKSCVQYDFQVKIMIIFKSINFFLDEHM